MTLLHNEMIGEPPHSITLEIHQLFSYHQYLLMSRPCTTSMIFLGRVDVQRIKTRRKIQLIGNLIKQVSIEIPCIPTFLSSTRLSVNLTILYVSLGDTLTNCPRIVKHCLHATSRLINERKRSMVQRYRVIAKIEVRLNSSRSQLRLDSFAFFPSNFSSFSFFFSQDLRRFRTDEERKTRRAVDAKRPRFRLSDRFDLPGQRASVACIHNRKMPSEFWPRPRGVSSKFRLCHALAINSIGL